MCSVIIQGIVLITPPSPRGTPLDADCPLNFVPIISFPKSGSFSTHLFVHLVRISWWSYQDTTGDHVRGFAEAEMHSIHYFLFLKTVSSHHRRHSDQWGTIHPGRSVLSLPDGLFLLHVVITSKIILVIILEADVRLTSPQLPDFFLVSCLGDGCDSCLPVTGNITQWSQSLSHDRRITVTLNMLRCVLWTGVYPAGCSFPSSVSLP